MANSKSIHVLRTAQYSALGGFVIGVITYIGYLCRLNLASAGFLCLILVVLLSFYGSMISATFHSIVAVACLDYFFTTPFLTLWVDDPRNILALAVFLTTSLAITFQVTRVRREKQQSHLQRKEVKRLYELAQRLLSLNPEDIDPPRLLTLFRDVFSLRAVCLFENKTALLCIVGEPRSDLEARTRKGYLSSEDSDDVLCRTSVRCLRVAGEFTGVLGFEWPDDPEFAPEFLSTLETTMLQRVRAFHIATQAAVAAQAESLRIMVLDALAHAVKTPLATVLAAMGGLRETGGLTDDHLEFIEMVEAEIARLSNLTSRLLRTATLDREEVRPRLQRVDISRLLDEEVQLKSQQFTDYKITIADPRAQDICLPAVLGDPELLRLALAQLLENACKYSQCGSAVEVSAQSVEGSVAIQVRSHSHIPTEERARIFDRFYRGKRSRDDTPGTGLGLDIARKITSAHGGTLALEGASEDESIFCITIPVAAKDAYP
jgi:two-component system, OmpR family, sensor histidine kinase KdpD